MNKRLLYNNIMMNISYIVKLKLNEDLLGDLKDEDDDDDSDFINYDGNIVNVFKCKPNVDFMNNYNKVGDLLTYLNNFFYIIKNNKSIDEIRRNLNTKRYGKIIGICVGHGLWLATEYDYTNEYPWSEYDTKLYNDIIETSEDDGWHNTTYILNNYSDEINDTIWNIYNYEISGLGKHICYIPAINQLKEIYDNGDIIKLNSDWHWYWSSSLLDSESLFNNGGACGISFSIGCIDISSKYDQYRCFALIHFE